MAVQVPPLQVSPPLLLFVHHGGAGTTAAGRSSSSAVCLVDFSLKPLNLTEFYHRTKQVSIISCKTSCHTAEPT